ncbi:MAG: hypothetical protein JWM04_1019 [Verrucomicrobiales bacterium]|nr:hypothetical protein [Verrucomicrobiales bacterium]
MRPYEHDESEPEAISRRRFLKAMAQASATTLAMGAPRLIAAQARAVDSPAPARADACILLWMAGGMAAQETLDPKRFVPFEKGIPLREVESTFKKIPTSVDGIHFTEGLENLASVMDKGSLIRSHVLPDLGAILHSRHQYHWHTGYVPPQTVACPHLGAWVARILEPRKSAMPAFVTIGQRFEGNKESEELKAMTSAGFLGGEYGPIILTSARDAMQALSPADGMSPGRFENRYRFYRKLVEASPDRKFMSDFHQQSLLASMDNADRLLSSNERLAFDISKEPAASADKYGVSRFGEGCLLARRLIEAGSRFVEVSTEFLPFQLWDTHANGHEGTAKMKREVDLPIAQLIRDLEARGLLDRTLVVVASEFSRDVIIEGAPNKEGATHPGASAQAEFLNDLKQYGHHRHFTGSASVLMFGGGMRRGYAYGRTAEQRPFVAVEKPVTVTDIHATILKAMGISPRASYDIE